MSEQQNKVNYVYVNSPDICVACGRSTIPGKQICSVCMDYVKACGTETIDKAFKEFSDRNYQQQYKKRKVRCTLHDFFRQGGSHNILEP